MTNALAVRDMSRPSQPDSKTVERLLISQIQAEPLVQARVEIDKTVVAQYANHMKEGINLPPVIVVFDGDIYWLADGFHRYRAATMIGEKLVCCHIEQGTKRDAILLAIRENIFQDFKRTNADKRKAVETLLKDACWQEWSDREIGRRCGVSHPFVAKMRMAMSIGQNSDDEESVLQCSRIAFRNGRGYPINVSRIGNFTD